MCPSMELADEISRTSAQNYTEFRCTRKGAGGGSCSTDPNGSN
jgi:hypothetical protein